MITLSMMFLSKVLALRIDSDSTSLFTLTRSPVETLVLLKIKQYVTVAVVVNNLGHRRPTLSIKVTSLL